MLSLLRRAAPAASLLRAAAPALVSPALLLRQMAHGEAGPATVAAAAPLMPPAARGAHTSHTNHKSPSRAGGNAQKRPELRLVGAIDQGTTSTRVILYDLDSRMRPVASHQLEHQQILPRPGWCEHDPLEILAKTRQCLAGALKAARAAAALSETEVHVTSLGITNQRETTVVWDKSTGLPLHNAVVWLDTRTQELAHQLSAESPQGKDAFRAVTGLPISTYFSGLKLKWMMRHVPAVSEAVASGRALFGTIDTWLLWNLTGGAGSNGVHVTDCTNASRTLMMDLQSMTWHAPTLAALGIPASVLPRIASNAEVYGHVHDGPLAGVPISGCLGDQQAAMLGQRCRPGEAKNTYGTGCFMLLHTGEQTVPSTHGLLTTVAFQLGRAAKPQYALEGSVAIAGAGVKWLVNNLGLLQKSSDIEPLAASVPDTAGVVFVPAFSGLFAPHWRDDARGTLVGLTQFSTKAHICRALLEAICFQSKEVLEAMEKDSGTSLTLLRVDGGAASNNLLVQLQADLLGVPVLRPGDIETTALGAALAAAHGAGLLTTEQIFAAGFHPDSSGAGTAGGTAPSGGGRAGERGADAVAAEAGPPGPGGEEHIPVHLTAEGFTPRTSAAERGARYGRWQKAVERSLGWAE